MKNISIQTNFSIFENLQELPLDIKNLMEKAVEIRKNAYAPYSKFRVGVAILLDNGQIVLGSNQENAAYPSGLCAERVAIFYAGANFPNSKIISIAISATSDLTANTTPIPPCGSCRQSIAEYEQRQETPISIYFMGASGQIAMSDSLKNLLPFSFDKNFL